jgi:FG-GAP-like repeat
MGRTRITLVAIVVLVLAVSAAAGQCAGTPTFTLPVSYFIMSAPIFSIQHADFDGDGDEDLVICNGSQIVVLVNVGAGSFAVQPLIPSPAALEDLAIGDFDEDGRPDVAGAGTLYGAGTSQGRVVVFLNRTAPGGGLVGFATPVAYPFGILGAGGSVGKALKAADLNADGILDVAVVDNTSTNAWVLLGGGALGLGDGTFGPPSPYPVAATGHHDVAIGDFDEDGAPDLALIEYLGSANPTFATLLAGQLGPGGIPTGTFAPAGTVAIPGPSQARAITTADVDADGLLDLIVANSIDVDVAYGGAGFAFTTVAYPANNFPIDLAIGDFTGDGLADVAVARDATINGGPGNFSVLAGQLGGGFVGYNNLAFNSGLPLCITGADFDGDGLLDVAAGRALGGVDVRLGTCPASNPPLAVTVVHPNGGEVFAPGAIVPIAWTKSASVALVDIEVSRNGGATWETTATLASGVSHSWRVTPPGTGQALVRVRPSGVGSVTDASDLPFSILGPGNAASAVVGSGCAPVAPMPALAIGVPVLGASTSVSIQGPVGAHAAGIFLSPVPPAPTPVGPGCTVFLDLAALVLAIEPVTDPSGGWSTIATLPQDNALVGLTVRAQAVIVLPAAPGWALTNAVELTFGF